MAARVKRGRPGWLRNYVWLSHATNPAVLLQRMDLERSLVSRYIQTEWKVYHWLSSTPLSHLKFWLLMVFPGPRALDLRWSLYVRLWRRRGGVSLGHFLCLRWRPPPYRSVLFPLPSPTSLPLQSCFRSPWLWELAPASPLRRWCSVPGARPTLWPRGHASVLHCLLEFVQTHAHWVHGCHPTISSSVAPFSSCPRPFPASGTFPMSQGFTSGGQRIGASAPVLPMNIQGWFPLGWTGLISLLSKGLLRVFSSTTTQKHQFSGVKNLEPWRTFLLPSDVLIFFMIGDGQGQSGRWIVCGSTPMTQQSQT